MKMLSYAFASSLSELTPRVPDQVQPAFVCGLVVLWALMVVCDIHQQSIS